MQTEPFLLTVNVAGAFSLQDQNGPTGETNPAVTDS